MSQHDYDTPPDDEVTGRTRLVNDVERRQYEQDSRMGRIEKAGKRHSWWVQLLWGAFVAFGFGLVKVGLYMSDVAHVSEVQAIASRQLVVETKLDMMMQMMQAQGEQMKAVAKTVKAPVVLPLEERQLEPPSIKAVH
jgi:hypothetical protein